MPRSLRWAPVGSAAERRPAYEFDIDALDLLRSSKGECHIAVNDRVVGRPRSRVSRLEEPKNISRLDLEGGARRADHTGASARGRWIGRATKLNGRESLSDSEKAEEDHRHVLYCAHPTVTLRDGLLDPPAISLFTTGLVFTLQANEKLLPDV